MEKIKKHSPNVWLVNTGWVQGKYGVGERMDLTVTREIIQDIIEGRMAEKEFVDYSPFGLSVPVGVKHADPKSDWEDETEYMEQALELVDMFRENIERFELDDSVVKAGM
jgi:phosphoenolpyruvate carboxykinase (ATP)